MESTDPTMWLLVLLVLLAALFVAVLQMLLQRHEATRRALDTEIATLRSALLQKDELLANTVHELRTPLTSIMASLDILHTAQASSEEDRAEFIEQGLVACRHLMFLLNDLLDHAAFEAGRLQVASEEQDVQELLLDARQIMKPWAVARGLVLDVEPGSDLPKVLGDRTRILQILFNLIGNAMKFSPAAGTVTVRAFATPLAVAIEVEDHGEGVPMATRGKLFSRFGRAHDGQAKAPKGTGIGLYLCRALVEQMKGSIGFRDREEGTGSVFWFTLPILRRRAGDRPALLGSALEASPTGPRSV